ncbi:MAG: WG repeat-containing protein [Sediminibacterium sp.]|nr:WG repeat-containing protein [Sediminibacterium sp.]
MKKISVVFLVQGLLFLALFSRIQAQTLPADYLYPVLVNGKLGYINNKGELQIKASLNKQASYELENVKTPFIIVKNGTETGLYSRKAQKMILDTKYKNILVDETVKRIKVGLGGGFFNTLYGYVDYDGKQVIPMEYKTQLLAGGYRFREGLWCFEKDGKQGYMDPNGNIVIAPQFESASDFTNGMAFVQKPGESLYGYIDQKGNYLIKPQFYDAGAFDENGFALVRLNNNNAPQSIIDRKGKLVVKGIPHPAQEDGFGGNVHFSSGLALVKDTVSKKYGYVDHSGKLAIPVQFSSAEEFTKEGRALVSIGGLLDGKGLFGKMLGAKWTFIDTKGTPLMPYFRADEVSRFSEGLCAVKFNGLWGFINGKGEVVVEPQWTERPGLFEGGIARVMMKSEAKSDQSFSADVELGYINQQGQYIWRLQK